MRSVIFKVDEVSDVGFHYEYTLSQGKIELK